MVNCNLSTKVKVLIMQNGPFSELDVFITLMLQLIPALLTSEPLLTVCQHQVIWLLSTSKQADGLMLHDEMSHATTSCSEVVANKLKDTWYTFSSRRSIAYSRMNAGQRLNLTSWVVIYESAVSTENHMGIPHKYVQMLEWA